MVQNPLDLAAERSLSSFDQRNRFSLTYTSSPVGIQGFWRNGWKTKAFSGWTLNGNFSANSGIPLTALLGGNLTNSKGSGAVGQLRADATGQSINVGTLILQPAGFYAARRRTISETRASIPSLGFSRPA